MEHQTEKNNFQQTDNAMGNAEGAEANDAYLPTVQTKNEASSKRLVHFSAKVKEIEACEEGLDYSRDGSEIGESSNALGLIKEHHTRGIEAEEAEEESRDLSIENQLLQKRLLTLIKRRSTIGTKLFMEGVESQHRTCRRDFSIMRMSIWFHLLGC
eukprot:Gb_04511 [translate_table: standard]